MAPNPFLSRRALMAGAMHTGVVIAVAGRSFAADKLPRIVVTRDPACGCCSAWIAHVHEAGFPVAVIEVSDLAPLKARLGVPEALFACHTAEVEGYAIEGHVPATAIRRLLAERPQAGGLAVAGMPVGSPGMEVPGAAPESYEVILFGPGLRRVFARYRGAQEI
jgi:hypothetical protein